MGYDEDLTREAHERRRQEEAERQAERRAITQRRRFEGLQIDPDVDFYPEVADREPGDTNWKGFGFDLHPQVTLWSAGLIAAFVTLTLVFQEQAAGAFETALTAVSDGFGWFYILAANLIVVAAVYFAFSRFGKIRIGGPDAKPEFTRIAWYSMLLSAGMGIGLMFWSVAEPIYHLAGGSPLFDSDPETQAAARDALTTTFFHWGVHPWAIYAIVSIALAFFAYNRGLPLTFRSVFYPVLGEKIYGFWGNVIDVLTVLATLFGLATSLGLGVGQAAAGLNYLFGWSDATSFQVLLIAAITGLATISVVAGLDGGVKRLSQLNMGLAGFFLVFMVVVGPTLFLLSAFTESLGSYGQTFVAQSFFSEAFAGGDWQSSWTIFYWGWWISWSPFVGMFIARVSKGRSIREIVGAVVLIPSLLSFLWMSVFGGSAMNLQLTGAADLVTTVVDDGNVATALFAMLENFPLSQLTSIAGVLLVISFFVTSSDSGSLVVDHLTSGGKLDSPKPQRVFWAVMEGLIAAVLLIGGGLDALQTAAITTGLPFAMILLFMLWSMRSAFVEEIAVLGAHYDDRLHRKRRRRVEKIAERTGPNGETAFTPAADAEPEREAEPVGAGATGGRTRDGNRTSRGNGSNGAGNGRVTTTAAFRPDDRR